MTTNSSDFGPTNPPASMNSVGPPAGVPDFAAFRPAGPPAGVPDSAAFRSAGPPARMPDPAVVPPTGQSAGPGAESEPAVSLQGVTKRYGDKYAIRDMNLKLPRGRVVGVLGPNGSGKSTMFRMLMGLSRPDVGEVKVLGRNPGWEANGCIAYLPDRARWYADHTVMRAFTWAQSLLPGFNLDSALRLAKFMNIDLDMRASAMSRGQEARLMLILCIARSVPLFLLDEPFSGIDVMSRERIIEGLIEHMSESERTVLISTHEIQEAESLFDTVVFLQDGGVVLAGDADELRAEYGSMYATMQKLYRG